MKIILTTTDTKNNAQAIAKALVEKDLSPCVQILPQATSIYRWKDKVEENKEYILLIKILEDQQNICKEIITEMHNYEVPELIELDASILNVDYANWFTNNSK